MNIQDALNARHGQIFHHVSLKNADGTPIRVRVTGKCQTWKTRPGEFRLPVKQGLYGYGAINDFNCSQWSVTTN
jgi:hypothetical protein